MNHLNFTGRSYIFTFICEKLQRDSLSTGVFDELSKEFVMIDWWFLVLIETIASISKDVWQSLLGVAVIDMVKDKDHG